MKTKEAPVEADQVFMCQGCRLQDLFSVLPGTQAPAQYLVTGGLGQFHPVIYTVASPQHCRYLFRSDDVTGNKRINEERSVARGQFAWL